MSKVLHLDNSNFAAETAQGLIMVDFWATWCGPCRMLAPILEQVAEEVADFARIGKVNIEEAQELAAQFKVQNIPTLCIFKDGQLVGQLVGMQNKARLIEALKNA